MPELPEVETLRRSLVPSLVGRRIVRAQLHRRDMLTLPGDPPGGWSRSTSETRMPRASSSDLLAGETVDRLVRRGKQIAIIAASGRVLVVRLGMTGSVQVLGPAVRSAALHRHATWTLDDGSRFVFVDPRRFGGLWAYPTPGDLETAWESLGPDALEICADALLGALASTRQAIKAALLDQARVAGVGNIYADEALHLARIHPGRPGHTLGVEEARALADAIRAVLWRAIEAGGSTLRDYRDAEGQRGRFQHEHAVYGRGGEACRSCGSVLETAQMAQRTTVWCAVCQSTEPHVIHKAFEGLGKDAASESASSKKEEIS